MAILEHGEDVTAAAAAVGLLLMACRARRERELLLRNAADAGELRQARVTSNMPETEDCTDNYYCIPGTQPDQRPEDHTHLQDNSKLLFVASFARDNLPTEAFEDALLALLCCCCIYWNSESR